MIVAIADIGILVGVLDLLVLGQIHRERLLQLHPHYALIAVIDERPKALFAMRERVFIVLAFQLGRRARREDLEQRFVQLGVRQRPLGDCADQSQAASGRVQHGRSNVSLGACRSKQCVLREKLPHPARI